MTQRRVLLLHAGGTLGMTGDPLRPADYAERLLDRVPELSKLASLKTKIACNRDSTDMRPAQWTALAHAVAESREEVDGVVIIHGTDTMAYSAAALAFSLQGLDIPVMFTGAQLPLASLRTDARRNLQDAVTVAIDDVPEVGICFDGLVLRGCRAVKNDASSYRAFASPGVQPLAVMGLGVDKAAHIRRPKQPFSCDARFDERVAVVLVHPGMDPELLWRIVDGADVRGVVLAALGVGNVPSLERALGPVAERVVSAGIDILVVTQWGGNVELGAYQTSLGLRDSGAISGGKMRVEAAVPKMMQALARFPDRGMRREWLSRDVAGEME